MYLLISAIVFVAILAAAGRIRSLPTLLLVSGLLLGGCALTPRGASLRRREHLYHDRLALLHSGQTRAELQRAFPEAAPAKVRTTGVVNTANAHYYPEALEIDPDFRLYVTFHYQKYRPVPDPEILWEKRERAKAGPNTHVFFLTQRMFPRGTQFYKIDPQPDDVITGLGARISRVDGRYAYVPL